MAKNTPVGIFIAAAAALSANATFQNSTLAGDNNKLGGLKEWTTDQDVDEEGKLDEAAQKAADKAKKNDVCIPIGEGENCW